MPRAILGQPILIVALLLAGQAVIAVANENTVQMPSRGICAHRGASDTHPENTIPAFREAIRLGVQMIEFDVALSKDDQLVLMHDSTVDRTTNGRGAVSELTLLELQKLDAGSWKNKRFSRARIPTLDQALKIMPENMWLNVHLKGGVKVAEKTTRVLVAHRRLHQSFLACRADAARAAKAIDSRVKICNMERQANSRAYVNETIAMKADFIQLLGGKSVDSTHTKLLRSKGIRINYCCANDARKVESLFKAGAEFPLVDRVSAMLKVADQSGIPRLKPVYRSRLQRDGLATPLAPLVEQRTLEKGAANRDWPSRPSTTSHPRRHPAENAGGRFDDPEESTAAVQPVAIASDKQQSNKQQSKTKAIRKTKAAPKAQKPNVVIEMCQIRLIDHVKLGVGRAGVLAFVEVNEGDVVKSGQKLAGLRDGAIRILKLDLKEAEVSSKTAKSQQAIMSALVRSGQADSRELRKLELEAERAAIHLERVKIQLVEAAAELNVTAPFDGTVIRVLKSKGEGVKAGESLIELVNTKRLRVEASVKLDQLVLIKPGMKATIEPRQDRRLRRKTFAGRIVFVDVRLDPVSRQGLVWAEVQNTGGALHAGTNARMTIDLNAKIKPPRDNRAAKLTSTRSRTVQAAIAEIERMGGEVGFDQTSPGSPVIEVILFKTKTTDEDLIHLKGLTTLQALTLDGTKISDVGLRHLRGLTTLLAMDLNSTAVTDAGLAHLEDLTGLEQLGLSGTHVTDAGLVHLQGLTKLQMLLLRDTNITDKGLVHLKKLRKLDTLNLGGTKITDMGLRHLSALTSLRDLRLNDTNIGDAELQRLQGLSNLQTLVLNSTKITDVGLVHLKGLTNLNSLWLSGTSITDAGLEHLKGLTSLQTLNVGATAVTEKRVKKLRTTLPTCKISR